MWRFLKVKVSCSTNTNYIFVSSCWVIDIFVLNWFKSKHSLVLLNNFLTFNPLPFLLASFSFYVSCDIWHVADVTFEYLNFSLVEKSRLFTPLTIVTHCGKNLTTTVHLKSIRKKRFKIQIRFFLNELWSMNRTFYHDWITLFCTLDYNSE